MIGIIIGCLEIKMLSEVNAGEYTIWTQTVRAPKDAYMARKVQKDRKKLKIWMNALLADRDLIVFHMHEGEETMSILTKRHGENHVADAPISAEQIGYQTYLVVNYILANEWPTLRPIAIHCDDITKFMSKSGGILEISKSINWVAHGHY
jgi:hypothetical protein